jgi:integrase
MKLLDSWEVQAIATAIRPMYIRTSTRWRTQGSGSGEARALQWKHLDLGGGWVHLRQAYNENGGEVYLGTPKEGDVRDVPVASDRRRRPPRTPKDAPAREIRGPRLHESERQSDLAGELPREGLREGVQGRALDACLPKDSRLRTG